MARRIFLDPSVTEAYTLKRQRVIADGGTAEVPVPEDERVFFDLRCLKAREVEERKDLVTGREADGSVSMKLGSWVWYTIKRGLTGIRGPGAPKWEVDAHGNVADSVLDCIDPMGRIELSSRIDAMTEVQLDQVKT